jgi:pimeloyl-ACP methyl ester carboxylesterase
MPDFTFTADDGVRLAGTLTRPATPRGAPAVLLLSGSGPLDRDSNMPRQQLDATKALAAALATHGIASLRFDKRGVGASGGEYLTTGFARETADAAAAIGALRRETGERVAVAGHSVGAMIAVRLAAADRGIAGIVLLSGAARPGLDVMRWQTARAIETFPAPLRALRPILSRTQARARRRFLASTEDTIRVQWRRQPALWMRELMAYDPAPDLVRIACPVLAITGRKDVQVDAGDIDRMRALVRAPFTGETPEDLTHLLRSTPGPPGLTRYGPQLRVPPDARLLDRVAGWVAQLP